MAQRKGRDQHLTSGNGNIHKRGDGLGTGPVGEGARPSGSSQSGYQNLHQQPNQTSPKQDSEKGLASDLLMGALSGASSGGSAKRSGGIGKILLVILAASLLGGGGTGVASLLSGGGNSDIGFETEAPTYVPTTPAPTTAAPATQEVVESTDISAILASLGLGNMVGGSGNGSFASYEDIATSDSPVTVSQNTAYNTWIEEDNNGNLNTETASGVRNKYTKIKGNGKDVVTIMVYMCGTDLESSYGMGTNDLQEMLNAQANNSNINLLVYTGGCKKWKNNVVSSTTNQIYQLKNGKMKCLVSDDGSKAMVDPSTLSSYIQYCASNFPADRYELIFWDHGGGSVTGYGYDEKYQRQGSMDLNGIKTALSSAKTAIEKNLKGKKFYFDFIGFDACLMATAETALLLDPYCDYMIASEESEPGVGWYYTDWLTKLAQNPSMDTPSIGKNICDDFVKVCASQCRGQSTTLSVIDVAEFAAAVPAALKNFSNSITELVDGGDYKTVATARSRAHEFAQSSRIDQIDLVHFAKNLGTKEGNALADALLSAVKYNRTSTDLTNCYGVSIYFPYASRSYVSAAVQTYKKIGLDDSYSKCIQEFASMQVSGQAASGGYSNGFDSYGSYGGDSLLGLLGGGSNSGYSAQSPGDISSLLGSFLGGGSSSGMDFLFGRSITTEQTAEYIAENRLDPTLLNWKDGENDSLFISMTAEQWSNVTDMALSMYYDDGEGYIDLGLDNVFSFDEKGNLLAPEEATWLAIDGQAVAYYYESMVNDGAHYTIQGYVPAFLNGKRVKLILVFDDQNPYGYIAGAQPVYTGKEKETELTAKNIESVGAGDKLDFICDYYSYDGEYQDSYYLGDQITLGEKVEISSIRIDKGHANMMYKFTDIYNQDHWSECVTN